MKIHINEETHTWPQSPDLAIQSLLLELGQLDREDLRQRAREQPDDVGVDFLNWVATTDHGGDAALAERVGATLVCLEIEAGAGSGGFFVPVCSLTLGVH